MKRVFIIHGWDGYPEEGWFPWLKNELEQRDFKVNVPTMPDSSSPQMHKWIQKLKDEVNLIDENTFFVGHSIGCQTILRYLETLPSTTKVGGVLLVAPWVRLKPEALEDGADIIAKPWLETPIGWTKVRSHCDKVCAIFSDDDPYVYIEDSDKFEKELDAKIVIEKNKGHFDGSHNVLKLNSILNELLRFTK